MSFNYFQIDSEFRNTVKAALGDSAMATDLETINASDVDEARMEELDAAPGQRLQEHYPRRQVPRQAEPRSVPEELSFRLGVVGLINRLERQPRAGKTFVGILERVVSGLVKCAGDLRAYQPLAARLVSLLNKVCGLRRISRRGRRLGVWRKLSGVWVGWLSI